MTELFITELSVSTLSISKLFVSKLWLDYLLAIGILLLAWLSLSTDKLFKSIVLFISLGLFVTLMWARLNAWDVAMAEAAIGAGLTGALLIASWRRLKSSHDFKKQTNGKQTHVSKP